MGKQYRKPKIKTLNYSTGTGATLLPQGQARLCCDRHEEGCPEGRGHGKVPAGLCSSGFPATQSGRFAVRPASPLLPGNKECNAETVSLRDCLWTWSSSFTKCHPNFRATANKPETAALKAMRMDLASISEV